jgi:lipopolysaccharide export system protein LptA
MGNSFMHTKALGYLRWSLLIFLFLIGSMKSFAQSPSWSVKENDFQYTMTYVGFLTMDGARLSKTADMVGAFVNGECRGVTNLIFVENQNRYYAYLTVYSNTPGEVVQFKIYNSSTNLIKEVPKTASFVINQHTGNLFQGYSFASPALNSSAELLDVNFAGVTRKSIGFSGNVVSIYLDAAQNLTALQPQLSMSPGASAFVGNTPIVSGINSLDFSSPVTLKIRSEDESIVKEWVLQIPSQLTYLRKNATCYAKGEIKIQYAKAGAVVSIEQNGLLVASQNIVNGETIFLNLNPGNYQVKAAGMTKTITILQL